MKGTIEKIKVYSTKGEAGRALSETRLIEGSGLEGDFHATGGERQLSLLLKESRDELMVQKEYGSNIRGLCFSRYKENICIRDLAPDALRPGARLEAGEAVLEISGEAKHCHEECALYRAGKTCPLAKKNLFAKVLKSGVVRVGDNIGSIAEDIALLR